MMQTFLLYAMTGILLFGIGVYGLIGYRHFIRKALAINIMSTGIFVLLVAAADREGQELPDPVPHALVLTGIVVAVCATALMLAIALRIELLSTNETAETLKDEDPHGT